jgi:hypothetical protein
MIPDINASLAGNSKLLCIKIVHDSTYKLISLMYVFFLSG